MRLIQSKLLNAIPSCQVRILNHITWKKIAQLEHPATIDNIKAVSIILHFIFHIIFHSLFSAFFYYAAFQMSFSVLLYSAFAVYVPRLYIRKWKKGQLWPAMKCHYTTSQWALPSSTPRANVRQPFTFRKWYLTNSCFGVK